ncbi:hypothetical protein [Rhodococcus xishaensis]|nr:hypothetical protein [Rhodococcus xishaensis]
MPGSTAEWTSRFVADFVAESVRELADGYAGLAATAAGNADSYEVSDLEFAALVAEVLPES